MYSLGDGVKNVREVIYYIEGDLDYLVSCGVLCLKGVGLLDYVNSENCLCYLEYCVSGFDKWQCISWEEVFFCIVKLMKVDCDVNFIEKNEQGVMVNCWFFIGMLCVFGVSNEIGMLIQKFVCFFGMLVVDNQVCV